LILPDDPGQLDSKAGDHQDEKGPDQDQEHGRITSQWTVRS
jgi:hypothetical protein